MGDQPLKLQGDILEIDRDARYFILTDRQGKPTAKIYWSKRQESDTKILKQRPGFFEEPMVTMQENTPGKIPEYNLFDLPSWTTRPADWPKRKPAEAISPADALIAAEVLLKAWTDLWPNCQTPDTVLFKDARDEILTAVKEDLPRLLAMRDVRP